MATNQKQQERVYPEEIAVLWRNTSKDGKTSYFKGFTGERLPDPNHLSLVGFYNSKKSNPKEPDLRISVDNKEGNIPFASLWVKESKGGNRYLTGKLDEAFTPAGSDGYIIAFINSNPESKAPYLKIYLQADLDKEKKEESKPEAKAETPKKPVKEKLPF